MRFLSNTFKLCIFTAKKKTRLLQFRVKLDGKLSMGSILKNLFCNNLGDQKSISYLILLYNQGRGLRKIDFLLICTRLEVGCMIGKFSNLLIKFLFLAKLQYSGLTAQQKFYSIIASEDFFAVKNNLVLLQSDSRSCFVQLHPDS